MGLHGKKTYGYEERDELERADFCQQLATVDDEQLVYVDESGMDQRDEYGYGYCLKGKRLHALKSGNRGTRVNSKCPRGWVEQVVFSQRPQLELSHE